MRFGPPFYIPGILVVFGAFVYANLSRGLRAAVDDALALSASQTAANLNVANGNIVIVEPLTLDKTETSDFTERDLTIIIFSQDGSVLDAAGPLWRFTPCPSPVWGQKEATAPSRPAIPPTLIHVLPIVSPVILDKSSHIVGWVQAMQSLGSVQDSL